MNQYRVVGLMSGTSLDGVDAALCLFRKEKNKWSFSVEKARTFPYDKKWKTILSSLHLKSAQELAETNVQYGNYLGKLVERFLSKKNALPDFVASHGHTIFHQPHNHFTFQLGDGAALTVASGLPVVCDFRSTDVALGGQGAPLVPIGDKLLFNEYNYCLNLGGIANISLTPNPSPKERGSVRAFDICPCNMVLNYLANQLGKEYDKNGMLASKGKINNELLLQLNHQPYYKKKKSKSLGREEIEKDFLPILKSFRISTEDKLATFCEHVALQVASHTSHASPEKIRTGRHSSLLITGGGAYNKHLISRIKFHSKANVVIPDKTIIEFKEAIIFAFLGVLRWRGEINCLKSVTGAKRDSCGGSIYI